MKNWLRKLFGLSEEQVHSTSPSSDIPTSNTHEVISSKEKSEFWSGFEDIEIIRFSNRALEKLNLPQEEKEFLISSGFPDSASPFLSFKCSGENLETVSGQWGLSEEFERYKVIGFNGSGDPVAVDESNGEVVYLNHDNNFNRVFMASSPSKLAEILKVYQKVCDATIDENGDDAFLDNDIPLHVQEEFKRNLEAIDPASLQTGTMWNNEIESMAEGPWD